jgi:Flp pilus assembly pilin Flp
MQSMLSRFVKNEQGALTVEYAIFLAFGGFLLITAIVTYGPEFITAKDVTQTELRKLQGVE